MSEGARGKRVSPIERDEHGHPVRKPNEGNVVQMLGSSIYLDSPTHTHGVRMSAKIDGEGWLTLTVEADESVKGWALFYMEKSDA